MRTIIVSEQDPAGLLMKKILVEEKGFKETGRMYADCPILALNGNELITIKEDQIYADLSDIETDLFIFASKHAAESGRPTLTVHPCGNWGEAKFGGVENYLCPTNASAMKVALLALHAYLSTILGFLTWINWNFLASYLFWFLIIGILLGIDFLINTLLQKGEG